MAGVSDWFEYALAATGYRLANLLSDRQADRTGAWLGRAASRLLKSRRRIANDNLRKALGEALTDREREQVVEDVFAGIGRTLFEIARFNKLTRDRVVSMVTGDTLEIIDRALSEGRGGVVVSPHYGNWEFAAAFLALQDYPVDVLVTTQHNKRVDALLTDIRESAGIGVIRMGSALRQIYRALTSNRLVAIAPDQHAPGKQLVIDFLCRPASVAEGPAVFSQRTKAPILPYCMQRVSYTCHRMYSGNAIYPEEYPDGQSGVEAMTREYMGFFESCIRKHPEQWMWTHRRWKMDGASRNFGEASSYKL